MGLKLAGLGLVLVLGWVIWTNPQIKAELVQTVSRSACDYPLPYKIGSIDAKFNISRAKAEEDVTAAAAIWNSGWGKKLFTEQDNAFFTINFVWDERTTMNSQIDQMQGQLSKSNASLQQQINNYEAGVKDFETKLAALNAKIQQYNSQGGAPPNVYNDLVNQQNQLKTEADALNAKARQLNLATRSYNSNVKVLNQDVNQFNQVLAQKPEEGLYDSGAESITIYFASDQPELIHTLAHELGHYLGMGHVDNPKAIMYPYTTDTQSLTDQDRQQLALVCREQPIWNLWLKDLQNLYFRYRGTAQSPIN